LHILSHIEGCIVIFLKITTYAVLFSETAPIN
jgi:hypothetical protein